MTELRKLQNPRLELHLICYGIGTVGAYILWYHGVARVSASTAGVFTGILPVGALVLSNLVLGEPILWFYWLGIGCVFLAIVLITRIPSDTGKEERI